MSEIYTEPIESSEPMRKLYADSISNAVALLRLAANSRRERIVTPEALAASREEFRAEYARMLGIDTCREVFGVGAPELKLEFIGEDDLRVIERAKFKLCDGVYFTGLLQTPKMRKSKAPLVVFAHGGGGSPELCCDLLGENNYGGVARRILARGCIVFAPQLLIWNMDANVRVRNIPTFATKYDRRASDNDMKQCGASIGGFEIYAISRALDRLLTLPQIDAGNVGMCGLSYGGFYTLYTMAYETRIKSGWSAAFFNDRTRYNWSDFVWADSAGRFLDCEVAGLCAPRRLLVDVGRADAVFDASGVDELTPRVRDFYEAADAPGEVKINLWSGGHYFSDSDKSLDFFLSSIGARV